ncbi:MAG: arginase family protein [Albidovulum sp.]
MSKQDVEKNQDKVMEGLYWWGVPTLFRCPNIADPEACDIALVGVPHSTGNGTTERDQHLGPRAVRDVSAIGRRAHNAYNFSPWDACKIHDLGDVALPEANDNERSIERIRDFFVSVDKAGAHPVSIGGDHSITGGILQALGGKNGNLTKGQKAAVICFDAHTDAYHNLDHFLGAKHSAAHWASYLVEYGHVDPERSTYVGIRGNLRGLDWLEPAKELGYEIVTADGFREMGAAKCVERIRERVGDAPVYITFDLDCLDPSIAPAVSNLEAGAMGLNIADVTSVFHGLRGINLIGGDVVCLMPTKDSPNKITAFVAGAMMFEIVSLIADRLASRGAIPQ